MRILTHPLLILSLCAAPCAFATFEVREKLWPKDAPKPLLRKHQAKTEAMPGSPGKPNPPAKISSVTKNTLMRPARRTNLPHSWAEWIHQPPIQDEGLMYTKGGLNLSEIKIGSLDNRSSGTLQGASLTQSSLTRNPVGWEIGVGYTGRLLRVEAEFLLNSSGTYDLSPLFQGRNESLDGEVHTNALLFHAFYDFNHISVVKPYVGVNLGIGISETRTQLINGIADGSSKRELRADFAWGFQMGLRFRIWKQWLGQIGYRYNNLGKVVWHHPNTQLKIRGVPTLSGVSFGIHRIF